MKTRALAFTLAVLSSVALMHESRAQNTLTFSGAVVVPTYNTNAMPPECGETSLDCSTSIRYHATVRRLTADEADCLLLYLHDYTQRTGGQAAVRTFIYD
jgi:hypothetical protein